MFFCKIVVERTDVNATSHSVRLLQRQLGLQGRLTVKPMI